jgi:hypothetical protein
MIRLGFVYRNLMVNVQPKNEKLRDRARRIVAQAAGCDAARAAEALAAAGNSVRAAIVMVRLGVDLAQARRLLEGAGNRVSAALELGNGRAFLAASVYTPDPIANGVVLVGTMHSGRGFSRRGGHPAGAARVDAGDSDRPATWTFTSTAREVTT